MSQYLRRLAEREKLGITNEPEASNKNEATKGLVSSLWSNSVETGLNALGAVTGNESFFTDADIYRAEHRADAPKVGNFSDIGSLSDAGDWLAYQAGSAAGSLGQMVIGGGLGAGAVKGLAKNAGAKALAGYEAKKLAEREALGAAGAGMADAHVIARGANQAASAASGRVTSAGVAGGMAATTYPQQFGENILAMREDRGGSLQDGDVSTAAVAAMFQTALDVAPVMSAFKKLGAGDAARAGITEIVKPKLAQIGSTLGKSALHEGATEAAQEAIKLGALEWVNEQKDHFTTKDFMQIMDSFAAGLVGGGVMGAAPATAQALRSNSTWVDPENPVLKRWTNYKEKRKKEAEAAIDRGDHATADSIISELETGNAEVLRLTTKPEPHPDDVYYTDPQGNITVNTNSHNPVKIKGTMRNADAYLSGNADFNNPLLPPQPITPAPDLSTPTPHTDLGNSAAPPAISSIDTSTLDLPSIKAQLRTGNLSEEARRALEARAIELSQVQPLTVSESAKGKKSPIPDVRLEDNELGQILPTSQNLPESTILPAPIADVSHNAPAIKHDLNANQESQAGLSDYQAIFEALPQESETLATLDSPVLNRAKPYFDAGFIKSPQDIQNFEEYGYPDLEQQSFKPEVLTTPLPQSEGGKQSPSDFVPTHELPDGTPVVAVPDEDYTWVNQEGSRFIEDDVVKLPAAQSTPVPDEANVWRNQAGEELIERNATPLKTRINQSPASVVKTANVPAIPEAGTMQGNERPSLLEAIKKNLAISKHSKEAFIPLATDEFNTRTLAEQKAAAKTLGISTDKPKLSEFQAALGQYWGALSSERMQQKNNALVESDDIRRKYGIAPHHETVEEVMARAQKVADEAKAEGGSSVSEQVLNTIAGEFQRGKKLVLVTGSQAKVETFKRVGDIVVGKNWAAQLNSKSRDQRFIFEMDKLLDWDKAQAKLRQLVGQGNEVVIVTQRSPDALTALKVFQGLC